MDPLTIILIVLLIVVLVGGVGFGGDTWRGPSIGLGGILLIVVLVLLLS